MGRSYGLLIGCPMPTGGGLFEEPLIDDCRHPTACFLLKTVSTRHCSRTNNGQPPLGVLAVVLYSLARGNRAVIALSKRLDVLGFENLARGKGE